MATLTKEQASLVRGAMYEAQVDASRGAGQRLNNAMIDGDTGRIEGDSEVQAIVASMLTLFAGTAYESALTLVSLAIWKGAAVPSTPTAPSVPVPGAGTVRPPTSLSDDEILNVRHFNYEARREYATYENNRPLHDRFMTMTLALHAKEPWPDPDPGTLLGMMAQTAQGKFPPNFDLIKRYAADVGITIKNVPAPSTVVQPPVVEQPPVVTPIPTPPPSSIDPAFKAQLRAALEEMGANFASDGTFGALNFASFGAPEGPAFGYVGVNDGASRQFTGIRLKPGQSWPNIDTNPNLPVVMGPVLERDGALSWDFNPVADPSRPFKSFLIYMAGFLRGAGPRGIMRSDGRKFPVGKYLDFGTFEAGRGWRFFTLRTGSATPDIDVAHGYDADNANPFFVKVAGQLRRVGIDADGRLIAGEVVDENA